MVLVRTVAFTAIWVAFWYFSSTFYMGYIHDVGGAYWSMGVYALPVFVLAYTAADWKLARTSYGRRHPSLTFTGLCALGVVLYWPGTMAVLWGAKYLASYG